jgi:hypothetical protein
MPRLISCTSCQSHVRSNEGTCPHCGAALPSDARFGRTAGAVLMGLTIAGCGPEPGDDNTSEGMSASEGTASEGSATGAPSSSTGTAESGEGSQGGGSTDTSSSVSEGTWGEPDYGVPDTGWYEETDSTTGGESTSSTGDTDDSTGSTGDDHGTDAGDDPDGGVEPLYGVGDSGR